jgi:hypothetical protein
MDEKIIDELQKHLLALGCDASLYTDEEILQGALEFSRIITITGVSAKDASEAIELLWKENND